MLLGKRTGVGVAVAGALGELAKREDLEITGYGLTWRGRRGIAGVLPAGVRAASRPMAAGALMRLWAKTDLAPIEWWTGSVDVVHGTNFVVPPSRVAGRLVTVNDLTAVRFPELCTATSRRYPALVRKALAGGAWVHTPSQTVADEVIELLGASPERVHVVAYGVNVLPPERIPAGEGRPYVLGLGTAEPRKNFPGLVRAFDRVAEHNAEVELCIAGPPGWGEEQLSAAISSARHRDRIHRTGWVADPRGLLAGAAVLAFPSLYEGFGFPPLEAMAIGVPVVATSAGSLPEVVGDAAAVVPPGDVEALADAISAVLENDRYRRRLIAAGRIRAGRYTWASTADGLAELYAKLAARS